MTRKAPTPSTVKKLFALSGNLCASPNCKNSIIEDNVVLGEICHIEAAEKNGPRFNSNSDDEYRRSFDNLLLLCEKCHKKVDDNEKVYTVAKLISWKKQNERKHEKSPSEIEDNLISEIIGKFMTQNNKNTGQGTQFNNQAETISVGNQIGSQINNTFISKGAKKIEVAGVRKVIPEFKAIIDEYKQQANPPDTAVIDYKNELLDRIPRKVYLIETEYLRDRKENGRIKSDVKSYERINNITLDESEKETQDLLRDFLSKNDPTKKEILKKQLYKKTQQQPAIITCDGFLVNGNRRKMALEELYIEHDQNPKFEKMRVVILPENVLELDIRKIENRYQMQDEGKSEYQGINRALTIIDNEKIGYSLRAQLRDDPQHSDKNEKDFNSAVKKYEADYINPLKCAERYIEYFEKTDIYNSISESAGDSKGRWEAFKDYSKFFYGTLENPKALQRLGLRDSEVGKVEDIAFKLIRKQDLRGLSKLHMFLRPPNMRKYLSNPTAKKLLFEIVDTVETDIPIEEKYDKEGNRFSESGIDKKWGKRFETQIIGNLVQAKKEIEMQRVREQPLDLLKDALKTLAHKNLKPTKIEDKDFTEALRLIKKIINKADTLYQEIDKFRYQRNKGK